MNNEAIQPATTPVAATAFGEEVKHEKVSFSLDDPRFMQEAERTEVTLQFELHCVLSQAGKPCFRRSDTALGTVLVCPKNTPADLVGKHGKLTIAVLPDTKFEPSTKVAGFVMPSKPVNFVRFDIA